MFIHIESTVAHVNFENLKAYKNTTQIVVFEKFQKRGDPCEFLEVYQGILPSIEFQAILNEITSGRMIALELAATPQAAQHPQTGERRSSVLAFRELAGPYPVHIAKELYPNSIRAQFGETVGRNAVHCIELALGRAPFKGIK